MFCVPTKPSWETYVLKPHAWWFVAAPGRPLTPLAFREPGLSGLQWSLSWMRPSKLVCYVSLVDTPHRAAHPRGP